MKLLSAIRTRVGVVVATGVVLTAGGTAAAAVVVTSPGAEEVADVTEVTSPAATTTDAPAAVEVPAAAPTTTVAEPPVAPVEQAPAATVGGVTEPAPPAPAESEAADAPVFDPTAPFEQGGLMYTPAPEPPPVDEPPAPTVLG